VRAEGGLAAGLVLVALASTAGSETPVAAPDPPEILVFAAASLTDALEEIGAAYEAHTGTRVLFSFAGSNTLARQIRAGAPADVFLSANLERTEELESAGLVRSADCVPLLSNSLAVIVPAGSELTVKTARDLVGVRRLALGDPEAVPAGIYARRWLQGRGVWEALRDRVVPTLDVRAALAAVESGAADAGIVYRTDAAISRRVRVALEVPAAEAPTIVYPAAVLVSSDEPEARAFLEHLHSAEARAVFTRLGFGVLESE
jgi:molybdate transport system substrate-binding protein